MKSALTILLTSLCLSALAQLNANQYPGFKPTEEDSVSIKGYILIASYYPLKDNFKNKQPTMEQVTMGLTYAAADCFILSRKEEVIKSPQSTAGRYR